MNYQWTQKSKYFECLINKKTDLNCAFWFLLPIVTCAGYKNNVCMQANLFKKLAGAFNTPPALALVYQQTVTENTYNLLTFWHFCIY